MTVVNQMNGTFFLRGQLLKGSPIAIKKHLDMVLVKLAAQQKKINAQQGVFYIQLIVII